MKKLHLLIFLVLIPIFIFSQSFGTIKYTGRVDTSKLEKKIDSLGEKQKILKDALNKVLLDTKSVNYTLKFNKYESVFLKEVNPLEVKNISFNLTELYGGKGKYYCNLKSKKLLRSTEAFGENFLINQSLDSLKWVLTSETKTIGKYKCYKATTSKKEKNSKGVFYKKIVAWYTPKINYPFGPKNYCNLPGLILELKINNFVFKATDILINEEKIEVKKPTKGKKVTQEEFEKIGLQTTKEMFND